MSTYVAGIITGVDTYFFPFADHQWEVSGGYEAPVQGWLVPEEIATTVLADIAEATGQSREVMLVFGDPDDPIIVSRVIVLGVAPADNIQRRVLLMTDVRWYFTRSWANMDVNIRRRVGDTRLVGDSLLANQEPVDTVAYASWSTNNGNAYTWDAFKEQMLQYLTTARDDRNRPYISFVTDSMSIQIGPQIVQEMSTDSNGTTAIARAIESCPGIGIYVSVEGVIHVYDRVLGAEAALIEQLPPPLMGHGDVIWVDNSCIRPVPSDHSWRVYVDIEAEVRFTYNATGVGLWADKLSGDPYLEPVVQVTDQALDIPAGPWNGPYNDIAEARQVGQGTWITQAEAFKAYGPGPTYGSIVLPELTDEIVANHWFGNNLQRYTIGGSYTSRDPVWSGRINEIMRCYRTVFRVNPRFWDRVRHAWETRAAVWDPTTGTRAPSPVYSNFNKMTLDRFTASTIAQLSTNDTSSYPANEVLANGNPSGFRVKIVDEELGIIEIHRDISRFPGAAWLACSPVITEATVTGDAGLNEAVLQKLIPTVDNGATSGWKLATVMSCAPASPNDLRRMYEIKVSMEEASITAGLGEDDITGHAPDQETRSHLAQARIAWRDDVPTVNAILAMFGARDVTDDIGIDEGVAEITPINLEQELRPLAKAIAASDLMSKLDHYVGSRAVPQSAALVPLGAMDKVVHRVMNNRAVTVVHCNRHGSGISYLDFLPATARAFLLKEIASAR